MHTTIVRRPCSLGDVLHPSTSEENSIGEVYVYDTGVYGIGCDTSCRKRIEGDTAEGERSNAILRCAGGWDYD